MATPEGKVIDYFKRELKKVADGYGYALKVDKPPAGSLNSNGRPDLFIDLGPFHFRCEMKAAKGKATALQDDYIKTQRYQHHPYRCHLIVGKAGVDEWIEDLPNLLTRIMAWYSLQITDQAQRIGYGIIQPTQTEPESTTKVDSQ